MWPNNREKVEFWREKNTMNLLKTIEFAFSLLSYIFVFINVKFTQLKLKRTLESLLLCKL